MQRACAAALLSKGTTIIYNAGHSKDDLAALDIIQKLGAKTDAKGSTIIVESAGLQPVSGEINCGESGLSIRMFTPIAALSDKEILVSGSGSLTTRPMNFFDEILPRLGVKIKSNKGKLPILVQGPLVPESIAVDGSLSSQFLTGLLMAYSAFYPYEPMSDNSGVKEVFIKVKDLKSKPYIDLTLDVMKKFGMNIPDNRNYEEFIFRYNFSSKPDHCTERSYTVEGDWSGGAFLLVAAAIAGPVAVYGLDPSSTQADKAILNALRLANATMEMNEEKIFLRPGGLTAFEFDATDCPDLFPPLVALAAYCKGSTKLYGVSRLAHKESNRALALQEEFGRIGVPIAIDNDTMVIDGNGQVKGAQVFSHHDHRIAMACAVAALGATAETVIEEAQAVSKSYPDFYLDLKNLGASVSLPADKQTV
jgi:3-phosphoshikimate 1-carboxyvinyltransferase